MPIETTGGNTTIVAQKTRALGNMEQGEISELSLETPEQADARIAATMGQIAENNKIAEVAQAEDAAKAWWKIEEGRQKLGLRTGMITALAENSQIDLDRIIAEVRAEEQVKSSSAAQVVEQAVGTKSEDSRLKKSSEGELFTSGIESATDIRGLMRRLAEQGDITAPDGYVYKKEDTLSTIDLLKDSKDPNLQRVTNTHGLRDKVRKLLLQREIQ